MNINDFIAGKKITEEDIARLKSNRERNPYLGNMEQLASGDGKILNFILGGKMPEEEE
ncbi:MAG: hypothetical protein IJ860_11225 [Eubacterium sp.]|nr:hypothetical protein [Eubacterium sp.]